MARVARDQERGEKSWDRREGMGLLILSHLPNPPSLSLLPLLTTAALVHIEAPSHSSTKG